MRGLRILIALGTAAAVPTTGSTQQGASRVSAQEYEGWRQYSVHCARCHGQDVLPNPVAANLLESAKTGGALADHEAFTAVVAEGRPSRGMPAFQDALSAEQMSAIYAYVKGRADAGIQAGRPAAPPG